MGEGHSGTWFCASGWVHRYGMGEAVGRASEGGDTFCMGPLSGGTLGQHGDIWCGVTGAMA